MSRWLLTYQGYDPDEEGRREALCTLGNGYFATRGAAPEVVAGDAHYPGTYFAGLYNRLGTEMSGRVDRERGSRQRAELAAAAVPDGR